MNENKVLILPGDGIGPEIIAQARRVLELVNDQDALGLEFDEAHLGGAAIDAAGVPMPEETLAKARESKGILLGAVGGPKWDANPDFQIRPEKGLLGIRSNLELFGNLRPAILYPKLFCRSAVTLRDKSQDRAA